MARRLVNFNVGAPKTVQNITFTAPLGVDQANLSQVLDPKLATHMVNYIPEATGVMNTRKGIRLTNEIAGLTGYSKLEWFFDDVFLASSGTSLYAVDVEGTETLIKSDFSADITDILRYGNYAFVASGRKGDKIYRISRTLAYDTQTANFTVGATLTGGTSGATARILEDSDAGTTGTLTLGEVSGTFQDNEIITDSVTGSATVNGTPGYTAAEISAAPKGDVLHTIVTSSGTAKARLFVGATDAGDSVVRYSDVDTGSNPSFNTWNTTSGASEGGTIEQGNYGTVKSLSSIGGDLYIIYENARARVRFGVIDSRGTVVQDVVAASQNQDFGGQKGAEGTTFGVFYLERSGLRRASGNVNDEIVSIRLGRNYFDDVIFDQAEVVHDTENNLIMATYGKESTTNNEVMCFKLDSDAVFFFRGWNISSFAKKPDGTLYGASAIDGKIYQVFDGFTDNGKAIETNLTQEVNIGSVSDVSIVEHLSMQAILFEGNTIDVIFDIFNTQGGLVDSVNIYQIAGQAPSSQLASWGSAGYGTAGWGSGSGGADLVPQVYTTDDVNLEFYRLAIRMTSSNKTPHTINWRGVRISRIDELNINNITKIT